jgi:phenylacetate-coenzyme A ligase PaaK-like adenylate-forming protein
LPKPEYTPPERAGEVARWLAETKARASPALLATTPSAAVRICLAGRELELDISGTTFSLGGEPYTEARAAILAESGCRAIVGYYISELGGTVGMRCAASDDLDEVHLLTDKLAVVARNHHVGPSETVSALVFTTLHPLSPKLVINLESDDYGVLRRRDCGCPIEAAGFSLHFHGVRSYEKLTSEGNTFLGSDVITLLEEVLPGRFGGNPTDYQLVEWEEQALSKVAIVISPRVGAVDDREVIAAAIRFLRSRSPSHAMMADVWSQSDTLQVLRREPYTTNEKFQSVHVLGERVP